VLPATVEDEESDEEDEDSPRLEELDPVESLELLEFEDVLRLTVLEDELLSELELED